MKKYIIKALKWALSKFEDKAPKIEAWPFPAELTPTVKKKPVLKKATTRTKKPAVVAKTARTKKAK
jgi:hypothetical protein